MFTKLVSIIPTQYLTDGTNCAPWGCPMANHCKNFRKGRSKLTVIIYLEKVYKKRSIVDYCRRKQHFLLPLQDHWGECHQNVRRSIQTDSGVFRISVRRRRGAVGVEGCGWQNRFVPKMTSLGAFWRSFNLQKTRTVTRSLGTRILRFNCETKLTKTVQKFTVRRRGQSHRRPSPWIRHWVIVTLAHTLIGHNCTRFN